MCPKPSVLVVEDEPGLQQILAESLEADGFAVAQAFDGSGDLPTTPWW
jgi:DNA-binding response OmpR family regulator